MQKFILVDGKKVEVNIFGSKKESLVLLPGWTHNFQFENKFIKELVKKYKVITISYPGYAGSDENTRAQSMDYLAKVVNEVIKKLKIGNYKLVGFSMGTQVVLKYLDKYHDKVRVVLISTITKPLTASVPYYGKVILKSKSFIAFVRKVNYLKKFIVDQACSTISSVTEGSAKSSKFDSKYVSLNGAYDTLFAPLNSFTSPDKYAKQIKFIFGEVEVLQNDLGTGIEYNVVKGAGHGAFHSHYKEIAKMIV